MYRKLLITGAACAALALAACGKKAEDAEMDAQGIPDANPTATANIPANEAAAPDYVNMAAAGDMFEIESSKLALTRSKNAEVKKFAQMMVDMHTQTTAGLKAAIATSGQQLTPPMALPQDMQSKLDDLTKATDADFDRTYLEAQIDAHQKALDLHSRYSGVGTVPSLKTFATETAPKVQDHLDAAKRLQDGLKPA